MDKAHLHISAGIMVQQAVQGIVADEGTGGIGYHAGQTGCLDGFGHGHDGNVGKVSGRTIVCAEFTPGHIALVVGDLRIPDVDTDPLRGDCGTAAGLADAKDHIGTNAFRCCEDGFRPFAEDGGNLQLMDFKNGDGGRQQPDRLPGWIDGGTAKGIKTSFPQQP